MPLISFKKQFAPDVESGKKHQTIRAKRKHPIKKGDKLYLYTGLRTKNTRKLGEVICHSVMNITISTDGINLNNDTHTIKNMYVLDRLVINDGFNNFTEMVQFFQKEHGLPFNGDLIKW